MSMFSSREPFNDDPQPYLMWLRDGFKAHPIKRFPSLDDARAELEQYGGSPRGGEIQFDFRPEYDRPQNNPTNPILVAFRESLSYDYTVAEFIWDAYLTDLRGWSTAEVDHARRVLNRLAVFEQVAP